MKAVWISEEKPEISYKVLGHFDLDFENILFI